MSESLWYKKIRITVEEEGEKLYKKDFKFYQVDLFLKFAKKIDVLNAECDECNTIKSDIEQVAENLSHYLKGDIASRKEYERILNRISKHLKKTHGIFPAQFYLYNFSFIGIISGLALGSLSYFIAKEYLTLGLLSGFTLGLIAGRIIGKIKDKKLAREGKVL